jgi:hypothetical protein
VEHVVCSSRVGSDRFWILIRYEMEYRDDLLYMLVMLKFMSKLDIVKFEMSQDPNWRGGGYFWPRE